MNKSDGEINRWYKRLFKEEDKPKEKEDRPGISEDTFKFTMDKQYFRQDFNMIDLTNNLLQNHATNDSIVTKVLNSKFDEYYCEEKRTPEIYTAFTQGFLEGYYISIKVYKIPFKKRLLDQIEYMIERLPRGDTQSHIWYSKFKEIINLIEE